MGIPRSSRMMRPALSMRDASPADSPNRLSGFPARLGGSARMMAVNARLSTASCPVPGEPTDGAPAGAEQPTTATRIAQRTSPQILIVGPPPSSNAEKLDDPILVRVADHAHRIFALPYLV